MFGNARCVGFVQINKKPLQIENSLNLVFGRGAPKLYVSCAVIILVCAQIIILIM